MPSILRLLLIPLLSIAMLAVAENQKTPQTHIRFICPTSSSSLVFRIMEVAFGDFFSNLDYQFHLSYAPPKRVIPLLNEGAVDGICAISDLKHKSLTDNDQYLLADDHHGTLEVVISAPRPLPNFSSLDQFIAELDPKSVVGFIGGNSAALLFDSGDRRFKNIVNIDRGVRMLAANRLEYLLATKLRTQHTVDAIHSTTDIYYSEALHQLKVYNALHKRHRELRPALNRFMHLLTDCLKGDEPQVHSRQWVPLATHPYHPCRLEAIKSIK